MKIIICVGKLTGGGAERVAAMWAAGFSLRGHDVSIVTSGKRAPITYSVPEDTPIFDIDCRKLSNRFFNFIYRNIVKTIKLHRIFTRICPDIVIAVLPAWGPLIYQAKWNLNFKVIGTDHNSYERPACAPLSKKDHWFKFVFNKHFDYVTVLTEADAKVIGNRLRKYAVLPNPLAFEPVTEIPEKKNIILAVGRVDAGHSKGFDILIKAFGMTRHDGWSLQIAGAANQASLLKYKQLAMECGIENEVEFTGFLNDPIQAYRDASIFCLSSRYEGFGLVLIEAMSQGCACVACDYKGRQSEIITDDSLGLTCPPEDPYALAKCLERMMNDEAYRKRVQHKSPSRAADFTLAKIMDKWNVIIDNL